MLSRYQTLATHLKIKHFYIAALSGGRLSALACASPLPEMLLSATLNGNGTPFNMDDFFG